MKTLILALALILAPLPKGAAPSCFPCGDKTPKVLQLQLLGV